MITNESIQKLKEQSNIVDVVSRFVPVHKNGQNYVCVCPFHADKNPSMAINEDAGFFHCFGCGASGDSISFIQKYKNIDFIDALKELANMYNFILDENKAKQIRNNEALIVLNEYYINELNIRREILNYLEKRKITKDLRIAFNLGYAPSANDTFRILEKANINPKDAIAQGVVKKNEQGLYPSFIERITFPIYDHLGFLIGFGGRTLNPNNPAKYVNSPVSKLFDKKNVFYAYHLAKKNIQKEKQIIICEGYMDTISLHKAGLNYAVAVLGTALTKEHLKYIKKDYEVKLCFDNDNAGSKAAFKAASLLSINNFNSLIITLKKYKDPGEYIENNDELALIEEFKKGENGINFCIEHIFKQHLNISSINILELNKLNPFDIKNAYQEVLKYTNLLDKFLAASHLKMFCQKYELDYELLSGSKTINLENKTQTKILNNNLEDLVLFFLINEKKDFNELIISECFLNQNIIYDIQNHNFYSQDILEFSNTIHESKKCYNFLAFLSSLAKLYSTRLNKPMLNTALKQYSLLLSKNTKIIHNKEKLLKTYNLIVEMISKKDSFNEEDLFRIKQDFKSLGENI